jgi:hypothetical protein
LLHGNDNEYKLSLDEVKAFQAQQEQGRSLSILIILCHPVPCDLFWPSRDIFGKILDYLTQSSQLSFNQTIQSSPYPAITYNKGVWSCRAVEGGNLTPGLGDDEEAGGGVPGFEVFLKEAVDAAAGDIAQVQGGGTAPAQPLDNSQQAPQAGQGLGHPLPDVIGKARGDEGR